MKKILLTVSMFAALLVSVGVITTKANTEPKRNDRATIQFTETVKLMNVFLKGEYVVLHDEDKMAKGEACTYIYDRSGKLVVSFHCTPVERPKSDRFRIVATRPLTSNTPAEIKEIQFAGKTEAHLVPAE